MTSLRYLKFNVDRNRESPSKFSAKKGQISLGKVISNNNLKYNFYLSLDDLARHMFIVGITGSGKSNFIQNFLMNFTRLFQTPFLLAEFKGEYKFLQQFIPNMLIFKVGENFSINIFNPGDVDANIHAERIFQIFKSGGLFENVEYSPQMEKVFTDLLKRVCNNPLKQSWDGFYKESHLYLKENRHKSIEQNLKSSVTAVINRIRRYSLGKLGNTFDSDCGIDIKDLFNHNVLLDLSNIIRMGGEKEDILFFLNMLFKFLWDKNIENNLNMCHGIKHITIIEDAQYFASQSTSERSTISSYIEDIAMLLRGTGECLISLATRINISKEILANCGVFVAFQNHIQKDFLVELLNLNEEYKDNLSTLGIGECFIRINSIGKPFKLKIPLINRRSISEKEITQNNNKIIQKKNKNLISYQNR